MKTIELSMGYKTIVDDDMFERYSVNKWYFSHGYAKRNGSAYDNRKTIYLHREICGNPVGFDVDHINGDTLDNRKQNLRICSTEENIRNQRMKKSNTSGYKGVSFDKRRCKWYSHIKVNYKNYFLGYFDTAKEAGDAYRKKALEYHGIFFKAFDVPQKSELRPDVEKQVFLYQ